MEISDTFYYNATMDEFSNLAIKVFLYILESETKKYLNFRPFKIDSAYIMTYTTVETISLLAVAK